MTEENSVIETFNSKKEDGRGSPKGLIIAIILLLVGGVGLGAYFFNFVEKKTTYKTPIVNNKDDNLGLESSNQMIVTTRKEDFNYKGNFEFNLDIPTDESKLNLKIEDFQTISIDKGLQSRISLGNFLLNVEKKYGDNKIELKNLDIITDEEKTYLKVEGEDVKSLAIRELKYSNPKLIETINNIFSNEYVEIDNAKKLINIIDSNDELIISFIKGMMSPNAGQYFKKYGITDKLNKKFFSKDSYKLFLEETLREDNKIYVKIKDESCVLAINLVNKIAEDMGETNNMDVDSCMEKLEQINNTLANNLYITQDGNKETINYSGLVQFEMTYENGEILFVNILAPTINIKYEEKHLSINFSLIVPGVNTSLKIEQDFKNKYKGSIYASFLGGEQKFLFETNYQNNILTNREIEGNIGDSSGLLKFVGSGDNKKGSFSYQFIEKEKIISKGNYSYDNGRHLLSIISPDITIKGNMVNTNNNSEFILNIKEGENTTINTKGKLNYSDNKINLLLFILNYKSTEGTLNSKIDYKDNNLDINIIVNDKIKDEKTSLTAKGKLSKDEKNIVILGKINDIVDLEGTIVGDKNSCKIEFIENKVEGKMTLNLEKKIEGNKTIKTGNLEITEKGENKMLADWKFDYSSGGVKYVIPTNKKEIEMPGFSRIYIPNMTFMDSFNIKKQYIIAGGVGVVTIGSVSSFVVLTKWLANSRDSKRLAELHSLEIALTAWLANNEKLSIEGLTPISYKGEIIAYQGEVSQYFDILKTLGSISIQDIPKDPNGIDDYIVSISSDGKDFSIAATLEYGYFRTAVRSHWQPGTKIELKNGETISLNSLVYKQENGKPVKTKLETEDDLAGFLLDGDTNQFPYSLED